MDTEGNCKVEEPLLKNDQEQGVRVTLFFQANIQTLSLLIAFGSTYHHLTSLMRDTIDGSSEKTPCKSGVHSPVPVEDLDSYHPTSRIHIVNVLHEVKITKPSDQKVTRTFLNILIRLQSCYCMITHGLRDAYVTLTWL